MTVSLGGERFELRERTAELSALAELLTAVARDAERTNCARLWRGRHRQDGASSARSARAPFRPTSCGAAATTSRRLDRLVRSSRSRRRPGRRWRSCSEAPPRPYEVATAFTRQLSAGSPAVVVLEDVHLADEATLDVLRLLGSRLAELPVLIARDVSQRRGRPLAPAPDRARRARRRNARRSHQAGAAVAGDGLGDGGRARRPRRRALPQDRRQPLLRHGGPRGRRRPRSGDCARCRLGTCGSPERGRRGGCWRRLRSCDRRPSCGCSKRSRAMTSPAWRRRRPPGSSTPTDAQRHGVVPPRVRPAGDRGDDPAGPQARAAPTRGRAPRGAKRGRPGSRAPRPSRRGARRRGARPRCSRRWPAERHRGSVRTARRQSTFGRALRFADQSARQRSACGLFAADRA